jgi:hypothetical protein
MSPYDSDDLALITEFRDGVLVLLRSPETAEHHPDYEVVASFPLKT